MHDVQTVKGNSQVQKVHLYSGQSVHFLKNKITSKERNLKKMRMIKGMNLSSQPSLHEEGGIGERIAKVRPKS